MRPLNRSLPRRRLLASTLCAAVVAATAASASAATALGRAPALPRPAAAPVQNGSSRPASCPALASDPDTGDGEAQSALGTFPWPKAPAGVDPTDFSAYAHTPATEPPVRPANWANGGGDWKLTSARTSDPTVDMNPQELCGVMGNSVDRAWQVTTGHPSTVIAITDSGIEWCDTSIVDKIYLNRAALPLPENAAGLTKPQLAQRGVTFPDSDPYDLNGDGVFNVQDYAADPRIARPYFCGSFISPADLIRAFGTAGSPYYYGHQGPPGFTEAIAGWNFLDNSNNPYDDVHYDHGSGEAEDSTGAANSLGNEVGTCPNCMVLPIRVGDSFIAQSDAFAQGVLFAVDSGATVIQEALGTLDITTTTRQAVQYAVQHGVPIVGSAADEEAEHHNLPAVLPHIIVVNSVTQTPSAGGVPLMAPQSYLHLNGCTNYGANIAVSVESSSCSSEATGKAGGIVGLAESAAADAVAAGTIEDYPGLKTVSGAPVPLSVNEIQQLVTMTADDIDFRTAAPPYGPPDNYAEVAPYPTVKYPTQPGYDMYTGYGRIDASTIVHAIQAGRIPPEAEIDSPDWFGIYSPSSTLTVTGLVAAVRASSYTWQLEAARGAQPGPRCWQVLATGSGTQPRRGVLTRIPMARIASLFPVKSLLGFTGGPVGPAGQPQMDRFSFTLRLVVTDNRGLVGMDRRTGYIHSDPQLLSGFPMKFGASIDAPPTLAPIGPGGENVLLVATTDGVIRALQPDGRELPGWPVYTAPDPVHLGEPAYTSGAVTAVPRGAPVGGVAVGDLASAAGRRYDVVADDYTGHVYAWDSHGRLLPGFPVTVNPAYSGPAVRDPQNRVLAGFVGAPALADLTGSGQLDVVAAAMDRHVYAWSPSGKPVPGWPVLVVDPAKVASVAPGTDKVTLKPGAAADQGTKLLDTPAIGDLTGSGHPDVVVGSNEEYHEPVNVSAADADSYALGNAPLLSPGNGRVYAIAPTGERTAAGPFLAGWPVPVADFDLGLLPDVADGTGASPVLAQLSAGGPLDVGIATSVGPEYLLKPDGTSALGSGPDGKPLVATLTVGGAGNSPEFPSIPAVGMGIFAPLGDGTQGVSLIGPAASTGKALDAALPDDQLLHDNQLDAWNTATGTLQPAFPQAMNDLQFIASPIAADVGGGTMGTYIVEGSAGYDIRAVNALGQEAPDFPKFTGGWMVNSPSFGPWGHLADQVLAAGTREGYLFVWTTPTTSCASSGPWPREHHDLYNTSNLQAAGLPVSRCG
jgi:hypothetical protein